MIPYSRRAIRYRLSAPPPWDPAWGPAHPLVREGRLALVGAACGGVVGLALGGLSVARYGFRPTELIIAACVIPGLLWGMRPFQPLRVRSVPEPLAVAEPRPSTRATGAALGFYAGLCLLIAPAVAAPAVIAVPWIGRWRRMRKLEAATGGTVVVPARRHRRGGPTQHSGLYLVGAEASAPPRPVARPASPYARLRP